MIQKHHDDAGLMRTIYMLIYEYSNICGRFLLTLALLVANPAVALELVMIEEEGCVYCARFNAEIAPAYPKTEEGRRAPLRRVDLHKPWPEDLSNISKDRFTPTFVLVHDNQELARLRGYPGDEHFWFLLNEMLDSINAEIK